MTDTQHLAQILQIVRTIPFERWRSWGLNILALSANSHGIVNTAKLTYRGQPYYIYWQAQQNKYEIEHDK
jgi:hypothetical protein